MRVLIYKLKEWYAKAKSEYEQSVLEKELKASEIKEMPKLYRPSFPVHHIGELPKMSKSKTKVKTGKTKRKKAGKKTIETKY